MQYLVTNICYKIFQSHYISASLLTNDQRVKWKVTSLKLTQPWKIHHFDGMKTRKDGDFHGRTVSFREGNLFLFTVDLPGGGVSL